VDPLAEQTFEPYIYAGNNPLRYIDPTGMNKEKPGEDGPPKSKNVMIYITDHNNAEELRKNTKKDGWDIFFAVDIVDGYNQVNGKYKDDEIENLLLRSHGCAGGNVNANGQLGLGGLSIGGIEEKVPGVKTPVIFEKLGLSYYTGRKGNKELLKEDGYSDKEIANYEAFSNLSNKVVNNGTFLFSGCQVGKDEGFTDNIVNSLSQTKNFTFYFNIGNGGISLENVPDSMKCNPGNCSLHGNIARYKSGQRDEIKDVIINNNSSKPIIPKIK
jgi:hypothetical protein